MKINKLLVIILILVVFLGILHFKSSFSNISDILSEKYNCEGDNRTFPSGNISGNYLNLNESERNKLLVDFIKDKE
jgi:hypothetical protein